MKKWFVLFVFPWLFACDDLSVPSGNSVNEKLVGVWKLESGYFAQDPDTDFPLAYLSMGDDGYAVLHFRQNDSLSLNCERMTFTALTDSTMILDLSGGGATTYLYKASDTDLTIKDFEGNKTEFSKVEELPESYECKTFQEVTEVAELVPPPDQESNLVLDGDLLWYAAVGLDVSTLHQIDPETGEEVDQAPLGADGYEIIFSSQDGDLWTASETTISRRTIADVEVDNIDTADAPISLETNVDAMSFDGSHLWIFGRDTSDSTVRRFMQIDSDAEPDTLVDSFEYKGHVRHISVTDNYIWVLTSDYPSMVVQLDRATLQSIATYFVPRPDLQYQGIAAVDSDLYLLGTNYYAAIPSSVILRVTP
jgi:hypothetical protein